MQRRRQDGPNETTTDDDNNHNSDPGHLKTQPPKNEILTFTKNKKTENIAAGDSDIESEQNTKICELFNKQ